MRKGNERNIKSFQDGESMRGEIERRSERSLMTPFGMMKAKN